VQRYSLVAAAIVVMFALTFLCTRQPTKRDGTMKSPRILKLEDLSFTDIDRLDRKKTIFLLTFGILEEHGPQLPVGSDYLMAIALRDGLISRLHARHPDYNFVLFPVIPFGECGANDLAGQFEHVGTYDVRFRTLRDVTIDLGASIARQKFQNIFILHYHGCLLHNMAFNDAAKFVSQHYQVRMVHLSGLVFAENDFWSAQVIEKYLGKGWQERIGWEAHAGAAETSANLYLREDLVKPEYRRLPPFFVKDPMEAILTTRKRPEWQGYWGDPAKASRQMGKDLMDDSIERAFRFAEKVLAGEDLSRLPLFPENILSSPDAETDVKDHLQLYSRQTSEVDAWLGKNGSERKLAEHQTAVGVQ
jgi:creatinine amidohydrolase